MLMLLTAQNTISVEVL